MAVFEDFGLDPNFGKSLTTDEMEKLGKAHTFLTNLKVKYDNWSADPNNHASQGSVKEYINSYAAKAEQQRKDAESLRSSMI